MRVAIGQLPFGGQVAETVSESETAKRRSLIVILSLVLLLIAAMGIWCYTYTHFKMFGQPEDIFAEEIEFRGNEIPDLATLKSYLKRFKNLKKANFGTFEVEAEESAAFRQEFPQTELFYQTVVTIDNKSYPADLSTLDISKRGFSDTHEFLHKLDYFPKLKTVMFGQVSIPETEKERLCAAYPEVSFEVIGTYEIYGKQVLENTETLDLRDVKLDSSLCDQLALLPQLRSVDLHDQPLSIEEKIALTKKFPDVSFGWTVKYGDEEYDSSITEFDLSGTSLTEEDLDGIKEACSQFPDLEKLVLCDCGLSYERLAELQKEMKDIKVVWRVYLGCRWSLRTDAVAFSVLIVHYDYPRMGSWDIEVLKYCTDLRALDLGHQSITDISVIGDYLPELRLLILADNCISDITPLAKLTHLHYVELFLNRIYDLSPLEKLRELVDVNISYNGGIYDIDPLLNSPMMERVWLEATSVGYDGLNKLQETYPDAKIVRWGSGSVDQGWREPHERYIQMMDMWFHDYYGEKFSCFDDKAVELGLRD